MQGVHRVGVGDSGALALAPLAPLAQDDLVRLGFKDRVAVRSCKITCAHEQEDCNVCAKAVPVVYYGGALWAETWMGLSSGLALGLGLAMEASCMPRRARPAAAAAAAAA